MSMLHGEDPVRTGPFYTGVLLRLAREERGLSLADVAATTRIPIEFLYALECGEIADDIAPVYAVGYARSYARLVGVPEEDAMLDARKIIARRAPRVPSRLLSATPDIARFAMASGGQDPFPVRGGIRVSPVAFEPEPHTVLRGCAGSIVASVVMWAALAFFLIRAFF